MTVQGKKPSEVLEILKQELPHSFKRGRHKQPLALGIHQAILDYYANDSRFSRSALRKALNFYTSSKDYLRAVIAGTPRIDMYGQPTTLVTPQEAAFADQQLQTRYPFRSSLSAASVNLRIDPARRKAQIVPLKQLLERFSFFPNGCRLNHSAAGKAQAVFLLHNAPDSFSFSMKKG